MIITKEDMISLLNQIKEKLGDANDIDKGKNSYNIFQVLGIEYNEVLICRFIGNLLDPHGAHGMGTKPLEFFINDVIGDEASDEDLSNAAVVLEEVIDNNRRVDIVIYLKNKIYPIEVKIWAGDQEYQLQDYYRYFFKDDKSKTIYYLTPFGWSPSENSRGDLKEQISCLSFEDISKWLKKLETFQNSEVQLVIKNFIEVINKMCTDKKELNDILSVLSENKELIDSAITLMRHRDKIWSEIRKYYLFSKLDLGDKYELKDDCSENDKKVDGHVLLRVAKKTNPEDSIALICVAKNLYITARKGSNDEDWTAYPNSDYKWRYITPEGHNGKEFALNEPTVLPDGKIFIEKILDEIHCPLFIPSDMLS